MTTMTLPQHWNICLALISSVTLLVTARYVKPDENAVVKCASTSTRCPDDGSCLPRTAICDGNVDCASGVDEQGCVGSGRCPDNLPFKCDATRCLPQNWVCDGQADCADNTDESICSSCADYEFQCRGDFYNCILSSWRCDGEEDCMDGSDEWDC